MKGNHQRLMPLLFVILQIFFFVCSAQEAVVSPSISLSDESPRATGSTQDAGQQQILQDQPDRLQKLQEGAELVQRASLILQDLDKTITRNIQRKNAGLLDSALYYGTEAFRLLFMNGPPKEILEEHDDESNGLSGQLGEAAQLLEVAAGRNNTDAIYMLAQLSFYGNYSYPRDFSMAFKKYNQLAMLDGNSTALHMVAFMYATGIGGAVERDQGKAQLYHTFAALGGDIRSEMTLAFRYHSGIAAPRSCNESVKYYKRVADKVIREMRSGPPGGQQFYPQLYVLAEEDGGVYGEGASASSAGMNAKRGSLSSDAHAALDDVLEYLDLMSRKGDFKATFSLGKLHYDGQKGPKGLKRNLKKARQYFMIVARQRWKDGQIIDSDKSGFERTTAKAAGYLGHMYLRGEGVEQSFVKAREWFDRCILSGNAACQHGLGILYLDGRGVPKDTMRAFEYFNAAQKQDFPAAAVMLGKLYLDQGEDVMAFHLFEKAARQGHIEAHYYLAEMYDQGLGNRDRSCSVATAYYKSVVEKAEVVHSSINEALEAYQEGDNELALIYFMMAAEQGYEQAQANVAWILDQETSSLNLPSIFPYEQKRPSLLDNAALALIFWTRSAKQGNIDSMVKMGDYYLKGLGADLDVEKAATCYSSASEFRQSGQALYNLGWMHENGVGLNQDFHLAKRYYDQALEANVEAYLPVTLSLFKLRVRSAWNTFTHGRINSIRDEPKPKKNWSLSEWVNNFLRDDHPYYHDNDYEDDRVGGVDAMPGGDVEGYYDDDIDDGIIETFVIMGLAALLCFLVYYRQQRQMQHRRREAERAQQEGRPLPEGAAHEDRGLFPPPDDPAFAQWAAGGVGH